MVLHSPPGGEKSLDELTKLATPVTNSQALLLTNAKVYSTEYLCLVFEFQFQHLPNPCTLFIGVSCILYLEHHLMSIDTLDIYWVRVRHVSGE